MTVVDATSIFKGAAVAGMLTIASAAHSATVDANFTDSGSGTIFSLYADGLTPTTSTVVEGRGAEYNFTGDIGSLCYTTVGASEYCDPDRVVTSATITADDILDRITWTTYFNDFEVSSAAFAYDYADDALTDFDLQSVLNTLTNNSGLSGRFSLTYNGELLTLNDGHANFSTTLDPNSFGSTTPVPLSGTGGFLLGAIGLFGGGRKVYDAFTRG